MGVVLVVDYGMGNLRSVANAVEALGGSATISDDPAALSSAERIILPGVGAFGEAMRRLRAAGWVEPLGRHVLEEKKPFLGICLGMQLLADRSFEHGEHAGLGWIAGDVIRITPDSPSLRVPHVGWNALRITRASTLLADLPADPTFYFVHSYQFLPAAPDAITGTAEYGGALTASVEHGHVFGTQFHPEKSQKAGLALLKNFLAWTPC